jgi:hexosaminidase
VVDNDGLHGTQERTGMIALRAGRHPITVRFFQAGGGADLWLKVRRAGGDWQEIPASWLQHR